MRMISGFGYRNPEGYPDPTAYSAINNVEKTPVENIIRRWRTFPQAFKYYIYYMRVGWISYWRKNCYKRL